MTWITNCYAAFQSPEARCESSDEFRRQVEDEVRYANITIIEGTGASQLGIGMATARIVEAILRDEQAVIPIGAFNPKYGTTLSLPIKRLGPAVWRASARDPQRQRPTHVARKERRHDEWEPPIEPRLKLARGAKDKEHAKGGGFAEDSFVGRAHCRR